MKTNNSKSTISGSDFEVVPQVKIRSDLRVGASLENCERALEDWKRSYYKWYEAAKYKSV